MGGGGGLLGREGFWGRKKLIFGGKKKIRKSRIEARVEGVGGGGWLGESLVS